MFPWLTDFPAARFAVFHAIGPQLCELRLATTDFLGHIIRQPLERRAGELAHFTASACLKNSAAI